MTDGEQPRADMAEQIKLENQFNSGASWFYWIAVLSIVNSIVVLGEWDWSFLIGLGATQIIDGFALGFAEEMPDSATTAKAVAFVLDLIVAAIVAVFGFLAKQRMGWVFIVGMVLYALDGLIFLLFSDYLSFGFHVFALVGIFSGYRALNQLQQPATDRPDAAIGPE